MKRALVGLALAFGLVGSSVAQTVANGPYYATPSWDQTLPPAQRFIVLANFNQQAVLDRETGLVWERGPSFLTTWTGAIQICISRVTGGRLGWRLPTIQELLSLTEPFQSNLLTLIKLPDGHPFSGVPTGLSTYWTATQASGLSLIPDAKYLGEIGGQLPFASAASPNQVTALFWCVRSSAGVNPQ